MIRFHIEFENQVSTFGEYVLKSGHIIGSGNFKALLDYDGDDSEWIESILEDDPNVVRYSGEVRE